MNPAASSSKYSRASAAAPATSGVAIDVPIEYVSAHVPWPSPLAAALMTQ